MITQTAEYALRAMVYLASQGPVLRTTLQIARVTQVPAGYLSKVLQQLARAGLVDSSRGVHGGFRLYRPADQISVLEVVNAVEPIRRFPTCPLGLPWHGVQLCPLHRRLDEAGAAVERALGTTTLADLLNVPDEQKPLCAFPQGTICAAVANGKEYRSSRKNLSAKQTKRRSRKAT